MIVMIWPIVGNVIGSLGSAAIQRSWALKDWNRQNEYNHPKAQVERLREAGLPLATMFGGQGGSTAGSIGDTQIDPSLGTAKGLESFMMNRMQKKQLELLNEQVNTQKALTAKAWADAGISDADFRRKNLDYQFDISTDEFIDEGETGIPGLTSGSNFVKNIRNQRKLIKLEPIAKQLEIDLKKIQKYILGATTQAQIADAWAKLQHTLNSNALLQQQFRNQEDFIKFKQRFFQSMREGETDIMSLLVMLLGRAGMK